MPKYALIEDEVTSEFDFYEPTHTSKSFDEQTSQTHSCEIFTLKSLEIATKSELRHLEGTLLQT